MRNVLLGLVLTISAAACTASTTADASLSVDNQSDFVITEIYLTDVGSSSWGPNLLAGDQLNPDETLHLNVDCGTYDAMLVDETNVSCEVDNLDLCLNDALWVIQNNTCASFKEAAEQRKTAEQQPTK